MGLAMNKKEQKLCKEYLELYDQFNRDSLTEADKSHLHISMENIYDKLSKKGRNYVERNCEAIAYES